MLQKMIWYFKQLFPLTYTSEYGQDGVCKLSIFQMWLGYCFNIKEYTLVCKS